MVSGISLGRPSKPEDIAGVAMMLASDYCSFTNGQTVVVDGGASLTTGLLLDMSCKSVKD
jgi:NAD(P)-dependent dehydrogenase (short-subunit alcohol dehydrogenase family)